MGESHILAQDNQNLQPMCIYRCGKGGIHVFYGYVNVGMPPEHFRRFKKAVDDVLTSITDTEWDGHVTLHYSTTSLVLSGREFVRFASTISEAVEALEVCQENEKNGQCGSEALPDYIHSFIFQSYSRDRLN